MSQATLSFVEDEREKVHAPIHGECGKGKCNNMYFETEVLGNRLKASYSKVPCKERSMGLERTAESGKVTGFEFLKRVKGYICV